MKFALILLSATSLPYNEQMHALKDVVNDTSRIFIDGKFGPETTGETINESSAPHYPVPDFIQTREDLFARLAPDDVVVVLNPAYLGHSYQDVFHAIQKIAAKKANIFDLEGNVMLAASEQAVAGADFLTRAVLHKRAMTAGKAADGRRRSPNATGRKSNVDEAKAETAKTMWLETKLSAEEISQETGIHLRTLYRMFGPRPFGPRPKVSRQDGAKA